MPPDIESAADMMAAEMIDLSRPIMDALKLAVIMRERQKTYFATRDPIALRASKAAEKRFDDAAAALLNPTPAQGTML